MRRREFLIGISGGMLATALTKPLSSKISPREWSSVEVLLEHLLPSEPHAPGAFDINAVAYLKFALEDPKLDGTFQTFLAEGIKKLDRLAHLNTHNYFFALSHEAREKVLRTLEQTPEGRHWLKEVLELVIEALLGDPVYSGNPNGVGWKWLHHTPGFPQPTKDKRYFLL